VGAGDLLRTPPLVELLGDHRVEPRGGVVVISNTPAGKVGIHIAAPNSISSGITIDGCTLRNIGCYAGIDVLTVGTFSDQMRPVRRISENLRHRSLNRVH
jgi:hypothetical protein